MSFDWLIKKMEQVDTSGAEIKIPAGGDFVRGIVGDFTQEPLYRMYLNNGFDLDSLGLKYDRRVATRSGAGYWYYWKQVAGAEEKANKAAELAEWKSAPKVWRWEMPINTVLGWNSDKDPEEVYGSSYAVDVDLVGLGAQKRTALQLLFLPSLVQATGLASGVLSEQIYNYENMVLRGEEVTPDYCERMVGPVEGKDVRYQEGELWQARTEIWAAMGEDNPNVWTTGLNPRTDTTSDNLAVPLAIMTAPGLSLTVRISRVAAPRMPTEAELGNEDNPYPFPMHVVGQVWTNREAAVKELGDSDVYPEMPSEWKGQTSPSQFKAWIEKYIADNYDGKTKKQVVASLRQKDLSSVGATSDELMPWVDFVMG